MRLPLRNALFWAHLIVAVAAGAVILLMAATGLLLAFEAQIQAWADGEVRRVEPPASVDSPSAERLLATLASVEPELAASGLTLRRDPTEAATLALGREGSLYVDPWQGAILGPGSKAVHDAFHAITDLHRFLGAHGEARTAGKATTGVANLLFLLVLLSGLYLWVPPLLPRLQLRNALWFRRGLSPKARDFNWHHVFGIWALLPLVVVVVSALPISFAWAGDLVLRLGGEPARSSAGPGAGPNAAGPAGPQRAAPPKLAELDLAGVDRALATAMREVPDWRSLTIRLSATPPDTGGTGERSSVLAVSIDRGERRGRPDLRSTLTVDRTTGAVVSHQTFAAQSTGRRARSWMRWLHTGEAGGIVGQAIGALACAAVLVLGWTGYALSWRRYRAWRARHAVPLPLRRPASRADACGSTLVGARHDVPDPTPGTDQTPLALGGLIHEQAQAPQVGQAPPAH